VAYNPDSEFVRFSTGSIDNPQGPEADSWRVDLLRSGALVNMVQDSSNVATGVSYYSGPVSIRIRRENADIDITAPYTLAITDQNGARLHTVYLPTLP
jgi:hypothetical protein